MFIHGRKRTASPAYPLQTSLRLPFWLSLQLLPHNGCSVTCLPAGQIYICCGLCDRGRGKHYLSEWRMVSLFRGISKYKSILLKTYNGSLTFCQGRGEGGAEKTTGGGAGDRGEGWWVLAQGQNCVHVCMCVCVCTWVCCKTFRSTGLTWEWEMSPQQVI